MLLLLKKNPFQLCFCIKENGSMSIKLSVTEPLEDFAAYGTSSVEYRMVGVAPRYFFGEVPFHFHSRIHSKSINLLYTIRK